MRNPSSGIVSLSNSVSSKIFLSYTTKLNALILICYPGWGGAQWDPPILEMDTKSSSNVSVRLELNLVWRIWATRPSYIVLPIRIRPFYRGCRMINLQICHSLQNSCQKLPVHMRWIWYRICWSMYLDVQLCLTWRLASGRGARFLVVLDMAIGPR